MSSLLSAVVKRSAPYLFTRNFFTGSIRFDDSCGSDQDDDDKCKKNTQMMEKVHVLEPIEQPNHTLRCHHNEQRQHLYEFGLYVATCLPKYVQMVQLQHTDELEILTAPEGIFQVIAFLRMHQNCCFSQCNWATAIDVPSRPYRFEVSYNLTSLRFGERVRVKTYTDELTPLKSQYGNYKVCSWQEREIYDMFGVIFTHHPDLRRLLTDYGFTGHPFRKDFPLVGYTEVRYDDELKKLVYEPVEFAQEMRKFDLSTPWQYYGNFHQGFNAPPPPAKKK